MNSQHPPIILSHHGVMPRIHHSAFIAPGAVIIGDVEIGPESSVWFGCVLRGDVQVIRIGAHTNIQDGTVIHVAEEGQGTFIGDYVTVGHQALLHACTIKNRCLIGMKSVVMDDCQIDEECLLATGAVLTPGKHMEKRQVWAGLPAKFWRDTKPEELETIDVRAAQYVRLAKTYQV